MRIELNAVTEADSGKRREEEEREAGIEEGNGIIVQVGGTCL